MKIYTDGGCTNNDQPDQSKRVMMAVVTDDTGIMLVEKSLNGGSNNIAELWAVAEALMFAKSCNISHLDIFTDSRNNLAWIGSGKVGKKLNDKTAVLNLLRAIDNLRRHVTFTISWVPREQNLAGIYIEELESSSITENA